MCLIIFAFQHHPDYPLVVAANRDEYYNRPTHDAHYWQEYPELFAGRDLEAGGTWMGITQRGRFAAVTNYRSINSPPEQAISRGALCKDFLCSDIDAREYLAAINARKTRYAGFNLLIGSTEQLFYYSNHQGDIIDIKPGVHGLSNGALNEPWPKVESGKLAMIDALKGSAEPGLLLPLLLDSNPASDKDLPDTGVGIDAERLLSSRFIQSSNYGTRSASVLQINRENQVNWLTQNFDSHGTTGGSSHDQLWPTH